MLVRCLVPNSILVCCALYPRSCKLGEFGGQPTIAATRPISPHMKLWSCSHKRIIQPEERLALQGVNENDLSQVYKELDKSELNVVAGEMYCLASFGAHFMAAMATISLTPT